eukprot:scaffold12622_cov57-Attheya_sp.AAC.2
MSLFCVWRVFYGRNVERNALAVFLGWLMYVVSWWAGVSSSGGTKCSQVRNFSVIFKLPVDFEK